MSMNYGGGFGQQFCPNCTPVGVMGQWGFNPYMQTAQFGLNPYFQGGQFDFSPYMQGGQCGFNPYFQGGQFGYGGYYAPVGGQGMTGQFSGPFGGYGPGHMGTYPMQPGFYGGGAPYGYMGGMASDDEIEEMVYDSLDADPLVPYDADIDVEVDAGIVTLTGTVPNKRIKHAVGDDAWWVPGVIDVNNQLQVSGRRPRGEQKGQISSGEVGAGNISQSTGKK